MGTSTVMVLELLKCFHDVAIQPSRSSFSTTFLRNYGRGESLITTTCLIAGWG